MNTRKKIYAFVEAITPPFLFVWFRKSFFYPWIKKFFSFFGDKPTWHTVHKGPLKGVELLFTNKSSWHNEMLGGEYDHDFFEYLKNENLVGKTIFDVGAHIGYSSLYFAKLTGPEGKVVAFEPNPFNLTRLEMILERNPTLSSRIEVSKIALSDHVAEEDMFFSDKVDMGLSSGSFIESADPIWEKSVFEKQTGFKKMPVRTQPMDSLSFIQKDLLPDVIKIDVEGAEGDVLKGARKILEECNPLLLIEVHSIKNMYDVLSLLHTINYDCEFLKKETGGRCFIACRKNT